MAWSKMKSAFDKAEKTANRGGKLEDNKEFIDSVNDYMTETRSDITESMTTWESKCGCLSGCV